MKKILSLLLTFITIFCFVACKSEEQSSSNSSNPSETTVEYTNYDLMKNGQTQYRIVTSDGVLDEKTNLAVSELKLFFSKATNATLQVVNESSAEYNKESKLILLGNTKYTQNSGVNVTTLSKQGFALKTVDSNVFILSADEHGTLYGVYEFLHQIFGFEPYAVNEIALMKNVTDLKLRKLDFTDSPDILWRCPSYGDTYKFPLNASRFRYDNGLWLKERHGFIHNYIDEFFPRSKYEEEHDTWYALDANQLCLTARGNETDLKAMQDVFFNRVQELVNMYYDQGLFYESVSFTQVDNADWCTCTACQADIKTYGSATATLLHFVNPVAKRVKEWMATAWPGHNLNIVIFAYASTVEPPVEEVNGEYQPIDDTIFLEDNVALLYATTAINYYREFTDPANEIYYKRMKKWRSLTDNIYWWIYSANFNYYFTYYDTFNAMQSYYQYAANVLNTTYLFDMGKYDTTSMTAFDTLKHYLNSKLAWNVDVDVQELTDNFFEHYFKEAARPMKAYFNSFRTWSTYIHETTSISCNVYTSTLEAEYYPKNVLLSWCDYIRQAYEAIEPLKTKDRGRYDILYDRIKAESLAIRYNLLEIHYADFSDEDLLKERKAFKRDAESLGAVKFTESKTAADVLYSKWGV